MIDIGDRIVQIPCGGPMRYGIVVETNLEQGIGVAWDSAPEVVEWFDPSTEGIWRVTDHGSSPQNSRTG